VAEQNGDARRVEQMGKYLVLWEVVPGTLPAKAKQAGTAMLAMTEMVKKDMKSGHCKDWGSFLGDAKGFSIDEGTEVEIMTGMLKYSPYIKFQVYPVASVAQTAQAVKAWIK
jgi:hypothetical protein